MTKLKVLVVDDAAFIRDMVRKAIRARFPGMEVDEAIDGRKAQKILSRTSYDLILCDWEMPEMSGIELLTWLRQEHKADTPFVMVTSRGDKENVVEAIQAGVTDYIGKPFSNDKLLGKVLKVMGKRHSLQAMEGGRQVSSGNVGDGSLQALTGGRAVKPAAKPASAPKPAAGGSVAALTAKTASKAPPAPKQTAMKSSAHLRFGEKTVQCIVKSMSLKQIILVCRAQDGVPSILESVVVDLEQGSAGEDIARLNAYVHQLQAAEPTMDSSLINVTTTLVDQDPAKLSYLSRMIAKGTVSGKYVPGA
ncbi:response regulator [Motiliproteus sp. SC1-56]|uniref:response regulator n=1 Tax=Motiliproteus sp. SC1-56 TaxID=2799565 RepID=UPI001A8E4A49|nr:response regulator [Motiliproteus sp. SC1-56]